ncbi:RHS repeat-associated core domain-containing protein [Actinoplanes sp. NPDC023936]|uniref:RHS repeat-associated core domain-containing protein n=1 Tax=Actinoplanes sp. NPDC023936 TaxID=3154910 RepID=UPI0033F5EED7
MERADQTSALITARLTGNKVKITGLTSETSEYFALPSGQVQATIHTGIVRMRRGDGWLPVDLSLSRDVDGTIAPVAHPFDLEVSGAKGQGTHELAAVGLGADRLSVGWTGPLPEPVLEANKATYVEALPGVDVVVEATREGVETFAVVKTPAAVDQVSQLKMPITGPNAAAVHSDEYGNIAFKDAKGRVVARTPAPEMWDARRDAHGEPINRRAVGTATAKRAARQGLQRGVDLTLSPDQQWLTDPAREFPITIDPQINPVATVFDTYVKKGDTAANGGNNDLQLGYLADGVTRSLIRWNTSALVGKQITSATAYFWNWWSPSCTAKSWEIWTTGPINDGVLWSNQPAWNTKEATSTTTKGYNSSCNDGWAPITATSFFQRAATAGDTRADMGIRATSETDAASFKQFRSRNAVDAAQVPYAVVNYNSYPVLGARSTSPSSPCTTGTGRPYISSKTPTLKAVGTDTDGSKVSAQFEWSTTAGTVIGTATSAQAASGSALSAAVPAGAFAEAGSYRWRARISDASVWSPWSSYCEFTIDATAPSATPVVSSTDFPAGAWSKAAGQAGSFTLAPGGVPDVSSYLYGLDTNPPATTVNPTALGGSTTVSITPPTDGPHTLYVRSRDRAGNLSGVTSYQFAVGSSGVTSPKDGDRTAGEVVLTVSAPTNSTGVRYQYRRSDMDPWTDVPAAHVKRRSNGAAVTWPVAMTAGAAPELVWKATDTVTDSPILKIRSVVTSATGESASAAVRIVVDRSAGKATSEAVGPGSVNLLTGEYLISGDDADVFGMGLTRVASSRDATLGAQSGPASIFGPQWGWGYAPGNVQATWLRKPTATTVEMVSSGGSTLAFAQRSTGGWESEPGSADMVLSYDATGDRFTVTNSKSGDQATFAKVAGAPNVHVMVSSSTPGQHSTYAFQHDAFIGADGIARPRLRKVAAPTSASSSATCLSTPSTVGCRVLEIEYAATTTATTAQTGDYTGRASRIHRWLTAPNAAAATRTTITQYAYDQTGNLREVWDPRSSPALKVTYAYDTAGRVTGYADPGQLPWTFTYGPAGARVAGAGTLLAASQPTLRAGTANVVDGTASTSIVYDVPTARTEGGPYDVRSTDVAAWGQQQPPQTAVAIFPADAVPASNTGRGALSSGAYTRATVHYLDRNGFQVNLAEPGGHISATDYNSTGGAIRTLTAGNRTLALGSGADAQSQLVELGLEPLPSAQRAVMLSTVKSYSADGVRLLEMTGAVHLVTLAKNMPSSGGLPALPAGTEVPGRTHTVFTYDQGRPTDGTARVAHRSTRVTSGVQTAGYAADGEVRHADTKYDWTLGVATETISDPTGSPISEKSYYNTQGQLVETRMPASNGNDAGTTVTSYYTATGAAPCGGRPEWADLECRTGPKSTIAGGESQPDELVTTTTTYTTSGLTASATEAANGIVRVTEWKYDSLDREISVTTSGGVGTPAAAETTTYDPATGLVTSLATGTSAAASRMTSATDTNGAVLTGYDALGRITSYSDATGAMTSYQYDNLDRLTLVRDSIGSSTTYAYDTSKDARGVLTSVTDSVAGTFSAAYDAEGNLVTQVMPGGVVQNTTVDSVGMPVARSYETADGAVILAEELSIDYEGQWLKQSSLTTRAFTNDALGRLVQVDDVNGSICTRRTYEFADGAGQNSNRVGKTTAVGAPDEDCPAVPDTVEKHTYDSADRLVDAGYEYDALGRTVATPEGLNLEYYADDRVHRQTQGDNRLTWTLDPEQRNVYAVAESRSDDAWTSTQITVNHYRGDGDRPDWIEENVGSGAITRNVNGVNGEFAASTDAAGSLRLHLTDLHGDVKVVLDPATSAVDVLAHDEFGVRAEGSATQRYSWLGSQQRSHDALGGTVLMGARVYDPATGRFLQTDPVKGGSANAYDYCSAGPNDCYDYGGLSECTVKVICGVLYNRSKVTMWAAVIKYTGGSKKTKCSLLNPYSGKTYTKAKCSPKVTVKAGKTSKSQMKDADAGTVVYIRWYFEDKLKDAQFYVKFDSWDDMECWGGGGGKKPSCARG